jgi:hypothetical protein
MFRKLKLSEPAAIEQLLLAWVPPLLAAQRQR